MSALAVLSAQSVSADEVTPSLSDLASDKTAEMVSPVTGSSSVVTDAGVKPITEAPAVTTPTAETPKVDTVVPNGVQPVATETKEAEKETPAIEKQEEAKKNEEAPKYVDAEKGIEKEIPAETETHTFTKAESSELTEAVKTAKESGVSVKEEVKPEIVNSDAEAQTKLAEQAKQVKEALKAQVGADAIVGLDIEKLEEAGIVVKKGEERKVFTDMDELVKFVKDQSKTIATNIETKHIIDKDLAKATEDLKKSGIEVVLTDKFVGKDVEEAKTYVEGVYKNVTDALKAKADLTAQYKSLVDTAKNSGVKTTEGATLTYDTAKEAVADLTKQVSELKSLIEKRDSANAKLNQAIADAKTKGVVINVGSAVEVASIEEGIKDIEGQVAKLSELTKAVEETRARLVKVATTSQEAGLRYEGETVITANGVSELAGKLAKAETKVANALSAQWSAKDALKKAIDGAKMQGLEVVVSPNMTVVDVNGAGSAVEAVKTQLASALADKQAKEKAYQDAVSAWEKEVKAGEAKVEADYQTAVKAWEKTVADGQAKVEADYQKALADFNKRVDAVKAENDKIKAENDKVTAGNNSAVAKLTSDSTAKVNGASYEQTVSNKVELTSTSKKVEQPLDVFVLIDNTVSFSEFRNKALLDMKEYIYSLPAGSSVVIAPYHGKNTADNYSAKVPYGHTKRLTLNHAKEVIDHLYKSVVVDKNPFWDASKTYPAWQSLDKKYLDERTFDNIEDMYATFKTPLPTLATIQFTDNWENGEMIDSSYVKWAKDKAKTFMSVIYSYYEGDTVSSRNMKDNGHPNIYLAYGKDDATRKNDIINTFKQTAITVTETKGATGKATVSAKPSVVVESAKLVAPSGKETALTVKENKVEQDVTYTEAGEYKLVYKFKAKANTAGDVTGTLAVNGSKGSTTVVSETKPRSILAIFDKSGSVDGGWKPEIVSTYALLLDSLGDNDEVVVAYYDVNQNQSYFSFGATDSTRPVSKKMDKATFAKFVAEIQKGRNAHGGQLRQFLNAVGAGYDFAGVPKDKNGKGYAFEDVFETVRDKSKTPVIIQFTDTWEDGETIDASLVEWAKKPENARTFMSVVFGEGNSAKVMREVGHPNIFVATKPFKKGDAEYDKVLDQIKATTTERTETKPDIKGSSQSKTDKLEPSKTGTTTPLKEVPTDKPTKGTFTAPAKPTKGVYTAPVKPQAPTFKPVTVSAVQVKTEKPVLGEVKGEAHIISVSKEVHNVNFKQEVPKEVTFEQEVTEVQAEVATRDVYVQKEKGKVLPNTGTSAVDSALTTLGILSLAGLVAVSRKKES